MRIQALIPSLNLENIRMMKTWRESALPNDLRVTKAIGNIRLKAMASTDAPGSKAVQYTN